MTVTDQLLILSDFPVGEHAPETMDLSKTFPALDRLCPMPLILPLQDSLTVTLPSSEAAKCTHKPFISQAPTFHRE
jgi:serine/threonine-protein kinase ATR